MSRTLEQLVESENSNIVERAKAKADAILLDIHLSEVRAKMEKTQNDIASALGVSQPTIAGMEKPGRDIKLSSLKRYVEAGGGKVSIDVCLPSGEHCRFSL